MPFAKDSAFPVNFIARYIHYLRVHWDNRVRPDHHAIELKLHPPLPDEVSWIFVFFEATNRVAAIGNNGPPGSHGMAHLADNWISDGLRLG
jgi:hypothetical protein